MGSRFLSAVLLLPLAACSGSGEGSSEPPPPMAAPAPSDPWAPVREAFFEIAFDNAVLIVGDASGVLFTAEKGVLTTRSEVRSASSAKLLAGATIYRMVEDGDLSLTDHPQTYLSYWTDEPADPRSEVTLAQLLGFTSGFNFPPAAGGCIGNPFTTLQACAREFYERGLTTAPGTAFYYGPAHLQIAGAIAEIAGGSSFNDLFRQRIADPLGLDPSFRFDTPSVDNPRVAGGATITGDDYAVVLRAILDGTLFTDIDEFTRDRTDGLIFLFVPDATEVEDRDWHYAAGAWRECDDPEFSADCAAEIVISSPGAFGVTPWIDFDNGYFGIIVADEPVTGSVEPSVESVRVEQALQPLIEDAIHSLR